MLREVWPRTINRNAQVITGIRRFMCDYEERDDVSPRIGDQHPDEEILFVETIDEEQTGRPDSGEAAAGLETPDKCNLIVRYSTRTPYKPIRTTDLSVEMLETTAFRTWLSTGTKSVMRMTIPYAVMEHTYETVTWIDPRSVMWYFMNTVNALPFEGFNRGCVLYLGGQVRDEYTNLGEAAWRARHRFWVRKIDWNIQYREGQQARDGLGNFKWHQTTGEPVMVGGAAGIGGWDMLDPVLYDYENFTGLYTVR